jgi:hypothetical protein
MGLEAERMHLLRSKVPEIPNEASEDRLQNKKMKGIRNIAPRRAIEDRSSEAMLEF